ncbi:MAG TPA: tetratricopeptide repeat protein [Nitrospirota bacterium]|jgi:tetratricopeptide (TPR) repeat protein
MRRVKAIFMVICIVFLAAGVSGCGKQETTNAEDDFKKGTRLFQDGKYEEALKAYDSAVQGKPDYAAAWFYRGNTLSKLGRIPDAVDSFNKAIKYAPTIAQSYYNKGIALVNMGKNEEALLAFDMTLAVDPKYMKAWANKGAVLNRLGRKAEAEQAFGKYRELAGSGAAEPGAAFSGNSTAKK